MFLKLPRVISLLNFIFFTRAFTWNCDTCMENVKTVAMAYNTKKGQKEFFDAIYHGFCEDKSLRTLFFQSNEKCRAHFKFHVPDVVNILTSRIESIAFEICDNWFYHVESNGNNAYTSCKKK